MVSDQQPNGTPPSQSFYSGHLEETLESPNYEFDVNTYSTPSFQSSLSLHIRIDTSAPTGQSSSPVFATMEQSHSPKQAEINFEQPVPQGSNAARALCKYPSSDGQCRVWGLASCLQIIGDPSFHQSRRDFNAEILRRALTLGPCFVGVSDPCCGYNTLLSLAVGQYCPVETLEFLLSNMRFRQEDGCRITDFVEQLGGAMVRLMIVSRTHCVENKLPDNGKKCLRLLIRAGSQNRYATRFWNISMLCTWLLGIVRAASTEEYPCPDVESKEDNEGEAQHRPIDENKQDPEEEKKYPVPMPALLDLLECIIEIFFDGGGPRKIEDHGFWTAVLQNLWTHEHVTRGTLTRVTDVTLRLLDIGASKQMSLPSTKGSSFIACIESALFPLDVLDPDLDDVDAKIKGEMIRNVSDEGYSSVSDSDLVWETRQANIERLQKNVLGNSSPSAMDLTVAVDAELEGSQAESSISAEQKIFNAGSLKSFGGGEVNTDDWSELHEDDQYLLDMIDPQ